VLDRKNAEDSIFSMKYEPADAVGRKALRKHNDVDVSQLFETLEPDIRGKKRNLKGKAIWISGYDSNSLQTYSVSQEIVLRRGQRG